MSRDKEFLDRIEALVEDLESDDIAGFDDRTFVEDVSEIIEERRKLRAKLKRGSKENEDEKLFSEVSKEVNKWPNWLRKNADLLFEEEQEKVIGRKRND